MFNQVTYYHGSRRHSHLGLLPFIQNCENYELKTHELKPTKCEIFVTCLDSDSLRNFKMVFKTVFYAANLDPNDDFKTRWRG